MSGPTRSHTLFLHKAWEGAGGTQSSKEEEVSPKKKKQEESKSFVSGFVKVKLIIVISHKELRRLWDVYEGGIHPENALIYMTSIIICLDKRQRETGHAHVCGDLEWSLFMQS